MPEKSSSPLITSPTTQTQTENQHQFLSSKSVFHFVWNSLAVIITYCFAKLLFVISLGVSSNKTSSSSSSSSSSSFALLLSFDSRRDELITKRDSASTYEEWRRWARELDDYDGYQSWRTDEETALYNFTETASRIRTLTELRQRRDFAGLLCEISADFHRRMCGITNPLLYSKFPTGTKTAVKTLITLLERLISDLGNSEQNNNNKTTTTATHSSNNNKENDNNYNSNNKNNNTSPKSSKTTTTLTREMKVEAISDLSRAYGHTALILNSSAAFGMYHLGIIKVLYENQVLPRVIFGRSSGAIAAAFLCTSDNVMKALLDTDKIDTSAFSKRESIKGPGFWRRVKRLFSEGTLMDVSVLQQFVTDNIGDITFEEAYQKTGRVLNIFVSRKLPELDDREAGWLLNYLTAPNITIASAAVASCATPFVYAEVPLLQKNKRSGATVECSPSSLQWTSGDSNNAVFHVNRAISRIRHLFNVNFFIVADASFMHLPFLTFNGSRSIFGKAVHFVTEELWRFSSFVSRNILRSHRYASLFDALNENLEGDVILFPVTSFSEMVECLTNPSRALLQKCRLKGEKVMWSRLEEVKANMLIEVALHDALVELHGSKALNEIHGTTALEHYTF